MIYILALAGAALVIWATVPAARRALDGWKTRLLALATAGLGLVELLDPSLVSEALGLDGQGKAAVTLGIGVAMLILREITSKPGALAKK